MPRFDLPDPDRYYYVDDEESYAGDLGVGRCEQDLVWPDETLTKDEVDELRKELRAKAERKRNSHFGFCIERAHG